MYFGKLLTVLFIITFLIGCSPRVSDETPVDTNKNLVEDALSVIDFGERVNEEVGHTVENNVGDTVELTIKSIFGEKVGGLVGEKIGSVAGKATGTAVKKSLGEDLFKVKDRIEEITGKGLPENDERIKNAFVHRCQDGDTCDIEFIDENRKGNGKVITTRILNLDTPELKEGELFAKEAAEFARKTLVNQTVVVELSEKEEPFDAYSRLLSNIWIEDQLYQELVIRNGLGIVRYVIKPDTKYASYLLEVEQTAKDKRIGVWSIPDYVKEGNNGFDMSVVN